MIVSLIVAMDERCGIGFKGRLPWHLSTDLQRFKALTMGHHLIMGRKTLESIGRPLPGRTMIVITRRTDYQPEGCLVAQSLKEALSLAVAHGESEVFVIGGGQVFAQALHLADRLYLTLVHTAAKADVFFPNYDPTEWIEKETSYKLSDERDEFASTFIILEKKQT